MPKDDVGYRHLALVDLTAVGFVEAHYQLGLLVGGQVRRLLAGKLAAMPSQIVQAGLAAASRCHEALIATSLSPSLRPEITAAVRDYRHCLDAWARGADLDSFKHPALDMLQPALEGSARALLLALFLQDDNTGCQTGIYRAADGSVILWHTEEEVTDSRLDEVRLVVFTLPSARGNVTVWAFVYPDLLPGPAFAWRSDGFVLAVDSLYLRPDTNGAMLANVATWLALRLGSAVDPEAIVASLAPFRDGYGLTIVTQPAGPGVAASRVEFAGEMSLPAHLPAAPGAFLFQVNVFSDKDSAIARRYERIDPAERREYEMRIRRTARWVSQLIPDEHGPQKFLALLRSRRGGDYAYSNADVRAYCVIRLSERMLEVYAGPEAAARTEPVMIRVTIARPG